MPDLPAAQALDRWRGWLTGSGQLTGRQARWLVVALQDVWLRDAVLLSLVPGATTAADEILAGADAASLEGIHDVAPHDDLLARGTTLLAAAARTAPPGLRADALALLAWAAWWSGDGTRGRLLAARALADRPEHGLATLVDQLLRVGVVPGWARRRRPTEIAAPPNAPNG